LFIFITGWDVICHPIPSILRAFKVQLTDRLWWTRAISGCGWWNCGRRDAKSAVITVQLSTS